MDFWVPYRTSLAFLFYSTKILILQPCLQVVLSRTHMGSRLTTFCESMAALCIKSACDLIDILPDEPGTSWLDARCPWWCALHYLMRSITILFTCLIKGPRAIDIDGYDIAHKVDKAVRWLGMISAWEPLAQRAWLLCQDMLSNAV
jgi:hypothetical protein